MKRDTPRRVSMRWLAWTMLMAVAFAAGAAGVNSEFNPVRTPPGASADNLTGRVIVKLRAPGSSAQRSKLQAAPDRVSALTARAGLKLRAARAITDLMHVVRVEPAVAGEPIAATVDRLRADPEVEYADAERWRYPHATSPNDPLFSQQWYMQTSSATTPSAVDTVTAWDTTMGSTGLVIADLDTGVRYEHPDLQWAGSGGRLLPGYTFISDAFVANDGDTWDADASDPGDWVTQSDLSKPECSGGGGTAANSSWHGTRVSGILGALSNNSVGIAGMTWSAWLLPVRVLGKCGGADADILAGMQWAAGIHVMGVPDNPYPARIENMSLGASGTCLQAYVDVINQLAAKNVLVVASAGNEGGPVDAPANCAGVAAVAGLRHAGTKVGYSSLGPEVALSAPAGNCVNTTAGSPCLYPITTTFNQGATSPGTSGYTDQLNNPNLGTSFSAPIVSGTAGLMLSVNGNLSPTQLIARLKAGSLPFPQTSTSVPAPPMCHVPTGPSDLQTSECICTLDGRTCGAGMASASGALNAALQPIAAVTVPGNVSPGMSVALDASGSAAACHHSIPGGGYQWASSDPAGHPVSSSNGPSTTVNAPTSGSVTVTLTVTDDVGKTDVATVTVSPTAATTSAPASATSGGTNACLTAITVPSPVTVSVSPATGSLQAGSGTTETLTATVGQTLNTQVTWQVNSVTGGNATVGTITTGGVYTVPAMVPSPATVTVTAVSAADSTRSGSAAITITAPSSGGGGGGSGGGALDVLSLLVLTLGSLARAISRPYNSR
jgi:serine protease